MENNNMKNVLSYIKYVSNHTKTEFDELNDKVNKYISNEYMMYKDKILDIISKIKYNLKLLSEETDILTKKFNEENKIILTKSYKEYYNTILNMNDYKKLYIITNGLSIIQETVPDEKSKSNEIISETAVFKTEKDASSYIKLNELYNYSVIGIDVNSIFSKFILCEYTI